MWKHPKRMVLSLISILYFFPLFFFPSPVNAHDNINVHPYIAKQAFFVLPYDTSHEIYQYLGMDYFDDSTGSAACAGAEIGGLIAEGAKEEDDYDPLLNVCNDDYLYYGYTHHFYKYDTGKGLFGTGPGALDYANAYFDRARQSYADGDKGYAYWYLGRIAHLIADVTVPAHVLDDPHEYYACDRGLGQDSYEFFMGRNFLDYSAGSVSGFEQLPSIASVDDIFTQLASHTAAYPSDDADGTDPYRDSWNNDSQTCDFFWHDHYIPDEKLNVIGGDLMPQAIKYTASLYQLFWLRTHDQGDTAETASDIGEGSAEYAEIYPAGDHDYFRFTVTSPGKYVIYTRGATNTYGVLYNGSGGALKQDNDSGQLYNFRLQRNITTPGTYYIEVKGGATGATGNYELHIASLIPANPPVVSARTPTKDTTPTWTWTSGGGGSGAFRYKCDDADLTTGATTTTATSFTPATALAGGTHTLYVQERAASGSWSASGSKALVIDTTVPTLGDITPASVTTGQDRAQTFTTIYGDEDGYANLRYVELQIGTTANGSNSVWARYSAATDRLKLFDDAGTTLLAESCMPGTEGTISNGQGTLNCLKTTVEKSGDTVTVNWRIIPKTAFAGGEAKDLKMRATDISGLTTGLTIKGSWTITSTASVPRAVDQAPGGNKGP